MKALASLAADVADIKRRLASGVRHGKVAQVDAAQGLLRLDLGEGDAGQTLSPWIPYAQVGGALKVHSPPSVGQQMTIMAPSGDLRQAIVLPLGFSDANPSPSGSGTSHVITLGNVTITATASGVTIVSGGVTMQITSAGVAISGGTVTHNGKNIGSTHTHGGVLPGGANTAAPN